MLSFIYKKINEKDFVLDAKNIDIFSEELEHLLSNAPLQHEDLLKLRLLTETVLINWMMSVDEGSKVSFQIYKFMGRTHLELSMDGEAINPLETLDDFDMPTQFTEMMQSFQSDIGITPV